MFYLFIRGMQQEGGSDYGVFYDRPAKELVASLEAAMVPAAEAPTPMV